MYTVAPASDSWRAMPRPMPLEAPKDLQSNYLEDGLERLRNLRKEKTLGLEDRYFIMDLKPLEGEISDMKTMSEVKS
ncbi:hypothetical protein EYF80_036168 [Liparis tanakae]|uniref:Uncharacterized protein n=1 Tax=Liparis tanakae TaxID=230148 RepID=A0A4Z2GLB8_9TELE|nr:hypothetical protein EYF80_036168 [Liparis tanakae]